MRILFNQKLKVTAFITSLLVVIFLNKQPIQQQQIVKDLSLSQIVNSPIKGFTHDISPQKISNIKSKSNERSTFYSVINEWRKYQYSVNSNQVLKIGKLPNNPINFNQADLLTVLTNTRQYFQKYSQGTPQRRIPR
jgi:hypothetical protein